MRLLIFIAVLISAKLIQAQQLATPQMIVYMSREAADRIINGHFPTQIIPLGGADYRKAYEDLSLSEAQAEVFQLINKYVPQYQYAVITRDSLYYRTDDNCSVIGDTMGGVDVSEACRNHDYCYRNLTSPVGSDQSHLDFQRCNVNLSEEIVKICKENGKDCSLGKVYEVILKNVSFIVYRNRQSSQAEMIKNLLSKVKDNPVDYSKFLSNSFFDFQKLVTSYEQYCSGTRIKSQNELMVFEKGVCPKKQNEMMLSSFNPAL